MKIKINNNLSEARPDFFMGLSEGGLFNNFTNTNSPNTITAQFEKIMTKITKDQSIALDWLVSKILATFEELEFDLLHIEGKRRSLMGKDRLDVLLWCNDLDLRCKAALADRLGISTDDLSITIKTLSKL